MTSFGAERIDENIAKKALELLSIEKESPPKPFLVPVPSGGINI